MFSLRKALLVASAAYMLLAAAPSSAQAAGCEPTGPRVVRVEKNIALQLIAQLNKARIAKGRQPLRTESRMMESALWKAAQSANTRGEAKLSLRCNDSPWELMSNEDAGGTKIGNAGFDRSPEFMEPQWRSVGIGAVIGSESPEGYYGSGYTLYFSIELSTIEGDGPTVLTAPKTSGSSGAGSSPNPVKSPAKKASAKRPVLTLRVTNGGVVPVSKPSLAKVVVRSATVKRGRVTLTIKLGRKVIGRKVVTLRNGRAIVPVTKITRARWRSDSYTVTAKLPGKPLVSKLFMAR